MIDLTYSLEKMLADIGAAAIAPSLLLSDTELEGVLNEGRLTRILVRGRTSHDVMPPLSELFQKRYRHVPAEQLRSELIHPVKKGIGNAYKRGNLKDPAKSITVRAVLSGSGAVVTVSDEGEGFDPAAIIEGLHQGEEFYSNHGSGFHRYYKTRSMISFTNGGSTMLVRFLATREPGRELNDEDLPLFNYAGRGELIRSWLAEELPYFKHGKASLERCRPFVPHEQEPDQLEIRYVLDHKTEPSGQPTQSVVSGRILGEPAARADLAIARQLYGMGFNGPGRLNIPRPLAFLPQGPLALFRIDTTTSLRAYLKDADEKREVVPALEMVGRGLRAIHDSKLNPAPSESMPEALERHRRAGETVIEAIRKIGEDRVERMERICDQVLEQGVGIPMVPDIPIHGDFGWNRVIHDEGRFFLYRFDAFRRSHPGFDLGGALADLVRFCRLSLVREQDFYHVGRDALLGGYFGSTTMAWRDDLAFFTVGALLLRLERLLKRPKKNLAPKIDAFLDECEELLRSEELV